jgi:hypothetical protein
MGEMGCTDGMSIRDIARGDVTRHEPIGLISMQELQAAQLYGHWVVLENKYRCTSKLVQVRTIFSWEHKDVRFQHVKFFRFTCIDQSGRLLEGEMTDQYYSKLEVNTTLCFIKEWGGDTAIPAEQV